ncbi:MAG: hypothetical protein MOGMAGMI_02459 [Candidatus Omnitrophica bacterium]|nr:hypothetical protein [Candidatus Omnitrophota bacterium]
MALPDLTSIDPGIPSAAMLRIYDLPPASREPARRMWLAWFAEAEAAGNDRPVSRVRATERLLACEFHGGLVVEYGRGDKVDGSVRARLCEEVTCED